jgi:hypothetical protein
MIAKPCVDLGIANTTFETARTLVLPLLSCRDITHPAAGAGELFGDPCALSHLTNIGAYGVPLLAHPSR